VAITDKDGVYGIPKAYHASQAYPDFKLIVGSDVAIQNERLTFLVSRSKTYGLLCRLITESFKDQPKGHPQLSMGSIF